MAIFEYQALTSSGRLMKGTLEAASGDQAGQLLAEMQLTVNSIGQAPPEKPKTSLGRNEFILFNQQLASLAQSGIPLERGLRELARDMAGQSMRKLINDVASDLESGVSIEQAIEKRQKHFPPLYSRILEAGVKSGRLSEMLISLNRHLEISQQIRRILFEAICYPLVILALAAVIITAIFTTVVPQFRSIFGDFDIELPAITNLFLAISDHVISFWLVVFGILAVLLALNYLLSRRPAGRRWREKILFRIPFLGKLYRYDVLCRLSDAMAVLIGAGHDIPESLRQGSMVAGSERLKAESEMLAGQMEQGANLMEAGQWCRQIPRLFLYSMQMGAQRNQLQDNLYSLSDMYAQQCRSGQAKLASILLPIMLVLLGGFLALTVMAMFMPMVKMISSFGGT
jgi:type IV pilus assembly protein PilC